MGDPLVVRLPGALEPAEVAELATLGKSLRLQLGIDDAPVTAESEAQAWRSPLPPEARRVLAVARRDGAAVGRGDAIFGDRDDDHLAEIGTLYVLPEFRRAGIGSALLAEVLGGAHLDTLLVATTVDRLRAGPLPHPWAPRSGSATTATASMWPVSTGSSTGPGPTTAPVRLRAAALARPLSGRAVGALRRPERGHELRAAG